MAILKMILSVYGVAFCMLTQTPLVRAGGFAHTSVFSTSGGSAAGESSVVGTDGITKGECSFIDSTGVSVTVKYQQDQRGRIINTEIKNGYTNKSAEEALAECREAVGNIQININAAASELEAERAEFEKDFRQQMDEFDRQQQKLFQQMSEFNKNEINDNPVDALEAKMERIWSNIMDIMDYLGRKHQDLARQMNETRVQVQEMKLCRQEI